MVNIPYREWVVDANNTEIIARTLHGYEANHGADWNRSQDWTTNHVNVGYLGNEKISGPIYVRWDTIIRPTPESFALPAGMDEPCGVKVSVDVGLYDFDGFNENETELTELEIIDGILKDPADPNEWNNNLVTGRHYDGSNEFASYPHTKQLKGSNYTTITISELPTSYDLWFPAGNANKYRADLFRNGYILYSSNYNESFPGDWSAGDECTLTVEPTVFHVRFLNAVVNSLSANRFSGAGGETLVLTGLGFDNTNEDVWGGWSEYPGFGGNVDDSVDYIYFELIDNGTTYTLDINDFTIDDNTQITIDSMPAMDNGEYYIKLRKDNVSLAGRTFDVDSYAGDWETDENGLVSAGTRLIIYIGPQTYTDMVTDDLALQHNDTIDDKIIHDTDPVTEIYYDDISDSLTIATQGDDDDGGGDDVIDNIVLSDKWKFYLTSANGKVYEVDSSYKTDDGKKAYSFWQSKTLDFSDQYPDMIDRFKAIYRMQLEYIDMFADTDVTIFLSNDGGETWKWKTKTLGNADGTTKTADYDFIMSGEHFIFRIGHSSATQRFIWTGMLVDFVPEGEWFEV